MFCLRLVIFCLLALSRCANASANAAADIELSGIEGSAIESDKPEVSTPAPLNPLIVDSPRGLELIEQAIPIVSSGSRGGYNLAEASADFVDIETGLPLAVTAAIDGRTIGTAVKFIDPVSRCLNCVRAGRFGFLIFSIIMLASWAGMKFGMFHDQDAATGYIIAFLIGSGLFCLSSTLDILRPFIPMNAESLSENPSSQLRAFIA